MKFLDGQYEDDFLADSSDNPEKGNENDSVSGESEIDEEISLASNNSPQAVSGDLVALELILSFLYLILKMIKLFLQDEVTADVSISKASGQGDYEENV